MEKNNMTAVDWFFEVLAHNDIIDHKKLCDDENLYNLLYSLKNQAEQMEKEQHQETFKQSRQAKIFEDGMPPVFESFEQYYNETYGIK